MRLLVNVRAILLAGVLLQFVPLAMAQGGSLPDLQQPPAVAPTDAPKLSPLLKTGTGEIISTPAAWEARRHALKEDWLKIMGDLPTKRAPLKTKFLVTGESQGFVRRYARYQVEKDIFVDGYLLTPRKVSGKLPAIVVFHPTTRLQAQGVAGLSSDYPEEKWQGVQLVKRGYVVWCPRNFIFADRPKNYKKDTDLYTANVEDVQEQHDGWTGMARITLDAIRAADFICSLPYVDTNRIGCLGHSLGAKVTLYAAAFDERYKATVSSEGGIGLKFSNWDAVWYLGPQITKPEFTRDNHEVLALVAPRAFLLLAGNSADNDKSWAFIEAVKPVYGLLKEPSNIGWLNHRLGHRYAPEARTVAEAFFDQHLKSP